MASQLKSARLKIDNVSGEFEIAHLGGHQFRLLSPSVTILTEANYQCGDIVEAMPNEEEVLVVRRCVERGNYNTFEFILQPGWLERQEIKAVLEKVTAQGGQWEAIFGGMLLIGLPPNSTYNPTQEIIS